MIFGTVATTSHLPKAMVLANSIKTHMPSCKVVVCLIEEEIPAIAKNFPHFDKIVLAKDINPYDNFYHFIFQYRVFEGAWSCKPMLLNYLFEHFKDEDKFVYIDSDIKVYGPFDDLLTYFKKSPILFTPHHHYSPEPFDEHNYNRLKSDGIFNAGFIAVSRNKESKDFIHWWMQRVEHMGYVDREKKLYSDQTWLDFAPSFFDVHVLRLPEYNIGPWNFYQRNISEKRDGYLVEGRPLKCFHFSGIDNNYFMEMLKYTSEEQQTIIKVIYKNYLKELEEMGSAKIGKTPWSYDIFFSGESIKLSSRLAFRNDNYFKAIFTNPFILSNRVFEPVFQSTDNRNHSKRKP